jgi:hypothetical protein
VKEISRNKAVAPKALVKPCAFRIGGISSVYRDKGLRGFALAFAAEEEEASYRVGMAGWSAILSGFFPGVVDGCFCRGFCENAVCKRGVFVVKLW